MSLGVPWNGVRSAFCNVHASADLKSRLQCSDWRRRPLAPVQACTALPGMILTAVAAFAGQRGGLRCSRFILPAAYSAGLSLYRHSAESKITIYVIVRHPSCFVWQRFDARQTLRTPGYAIIPHTPPFQLLSLWLHWRCVGFNA